MPLKDVFGEWYAVPVPNFTEAQLNARIGAVAALGEGLKKQDVVSLVRCFFGLPIGEDYRQSLRNQLKLKDGTFVSQDNAELAVIAAGVIYEVVEDSGTDDANAVALGVLCFEAAGLRKTERVQAVVQRCKDFLIQKGISIRDEVPKAPDFPHPSLAASVGKLKEKHPGLEQYAPAVDELLLKISQAAKVYAQEVGSLLANMERRRREESNIMYWLLSATTLSDQVPYEKIGAKEAALAVAVDLAKITEDVPGPAAARAFMGRIIQVSAGEKSSVGISDCVNALGESRRVSLAQYYKGTDPALTPLLFAVSKCNEAGGAGDWTTPFKTQTLLDPKKKLDLADLSEQLYSELLVMRVLA